jgi:hypothetical protein
MLFLGFAALGDDMQSRIFSAISILSIVSLLPGCGFLPGFAIWEDPAIYVFSVSDVANQLTCELQDFAANQETQQRQIKNPKNDPAHYKWVLDVNSDIAMKLNLTTDTAGYVNFTGINLAKLGFESLAQFVSTTSSVPSLGAKATGKRTRTVEVDFSASAKPLASLPKNAEGRTYNCTHLKLDKNLVSHLFLEDWLTNYFWRINDDYLHRPVPSQYKMSQVELSSGIFLGVDVSGGSTPALTGGGKTFIVPINGLGLDYNPDYSHKIDMVIKVCDNSPTTFTYFKDGKTVTEDVPNPCYKKPNVYESDSLKRQQCRIYSYIVPLLTGVQPPPDIDKSKDEHWTCTKEGVYVPKPNPPSSKPPSPEAPALLN